MTKEEVLEAASVMIAYTNGKKIGVRRIRSTEPLLHILYVPTWNWEEKEYRVIPDPTYRPWTADEVPLGAWMRFKRNPQDRVLLGWVSVQADRDMWLDEREHSTDGGLNWKPCGVEEVGK